MLISVAPFALLLLLWFLIAGQLRRGGSNTKKNLVDPLREIVQTDIVPEIRALRESVDALRKELADRR